MSKKVDLHDIAQITVGNVLNNYARSSKNLQELLEKALDKIKLDRKTKTDLKRELEFARKAFPYLASIDPTANEWFLSSVRQLRAQLDEPYEYIEWTKACIREVNNALDNAIMITFANKERIQTWMMAHVSTKGTELDWSSVVTPQAMKFVREISEEEEED